MSSSGTTAWSRFLPQALEETGNVARASFHAGRRVLVTGAGGYIGSALVKAIAGTIADFRPSCIVLLDSSEHNLFQIQRSLEQALPDVPHHTCLGTVDDAEFLDGIFSRFQPEIVYHAAAFKHVPLLELNPVAAVQNNSIGTWTLARAAIRHGASQFVLISTDKAVNPHSVMGVSKRIAELAVVALSSTECRMNAIRLVNVIGSGGSVVPVFLNQIAESRPVTVTHPETTRWFLTLRETVEAVLACGAAACEGRILLGEVGEPVRIAELAEFLIRTAGKDVPIRFIGLRPGDKLAEELLHKTEMPDGVVEGPLEVIRTRRLAPAELEDVMDQLFGCIARCDSSGLIRVLSSVVPEYVPSRIVQETIARAAPVGPRV